MATSRRSLFLLVMKTGMKESIIWMIIMVTMSSLHTCCATLKLKQTDATNSDSEPSASELGLVVSPRTHESVDLNDVSSGYVSGSSGEYISPGPSHHRELEKSGALITPDQDFQSGDNIRAKDVSMDATDSKSDTHSGDTEQMLQEDEVIIHKESPFRRRNPAETTEDETRVHSTKTAVPGMMSSSGNVSAFSSEPTEMLTPSLGFTTTLKQLLGADGHDLKTHDVEYMASTPSNEQIKSITETASSDPTSDATAEGPETTAEEGIMTEDVTDSFTETKTISGSSKESVTVEPEGKLTKSSNASSTYQEHPGSSRAFVTSGNAHMMTDARIVVARNERNSNESHAEDTTSRKALGDTGKGVTHTQSDVAAYSDRRASHIDRTDDTYSTAQVVSTTDDEAALFSEDGTAATSPRDEMVDKELMGRTHSDITEPQIFSEGYSTTDTGLFITQMEQETSVDSSRGRSTREFSVPRFTADGSYGTLVYRTRRQSSEQTDGDAFRLTTAEAPSTTPSNVGEYTSPSMPSTDTSVLTQSSTEQTSSSQVTSGLPEEQTTFEPSTTDTSTSDFGGNATTSDVSSDTTTPNVVASSTSTTMSSTAATSSEAPTTTTTTTMAPVTCPPGSFRDGFICLKEPDDVQVEVAGNCVKLTWTGGGFTYNVAVWSVGGRVLFREQIRFRKSFERCNLVPPGTTFRASVSLEEGGKEAFSDVITIEPSKPKNLKLAEVNETCVTSTWSPATGHTDSYEVRIMAAESPAGNDFAILAETNETSWTQCGLLPGVSFNLSVSSVSNSVRSLDAARLGPAATVPSPPRAGKWTPCPWNRQSCIIVEWAPGEGLSSGRYKVVRLASEKSRKNEVRRVDGTNTSFTRLKAATRYTFRIRAINHPGRLSLVPLEIKACTAPEPVTTIRKSRVDSTWVEFWWNRQYSASDEYIVQWNDTEDAVRSMTVNSYQRRIKIDSLHPGTTYDFRLVTVFCDLRTSSEPLTVTTELSDLTVEVEPLGTSLNISWAMEGKHAQPPHSSVYVLLEVKPDDGSGDKTVTFIRSSPYIYDTHVSGTCFSITLTPIKNRHRGKSFAAHAYTDEAAPGKVTNLQARRLPDDRAAINVTWSRPNMTNGVISYYEILVRGHRNLRHINSTLSCQAECQAQCPGQTSVMSQTRVPRSVQDWKFSGNDVDFFLLVGNLSEYENYDVQVMAATEAARGPPASVVVYEQLLDLVADFAITVGNASCLNLTWDRPVNALNTSVVSYLIEYGSRDEAAVEDVRLDEVAVVNTTETALSVCGLEFWTEYEFNVTAFGVQGFAGKTLVEKERTAEHVPDKVVNLTVTTETNILQPRKLRVRWSEPVHKYGIIISYSVTVLNNDTLETVGTKDVSPRSELNDSTGVYFAAEFLLTGDNDYTVQVVGATGAGRGSVAQTSVRMPAGAVPRKGQSVYLGPKSSVGMETAHVGLPWHLLCDVSRYGRPLIAGYIVFREKWSGAVEDIRDEGVSTGPQPVVTKTWTQSNQDAPDVAFLVQLPMQQLRRRCLTVVNRTFGIPVEVGSRSRSGSVLLCGKRLTGGETGGTAGTAAGGGGGGGIAQCGGGPLRPDTVYHVQAVVCNAAACTYSQPSPSFRTLQPPVIEDNNSDVLAAGMSVCFLLMILGGLAAGYILYRRRRKPPSPGPLTSRTEQPQAMAEASCRSRPVQLDDFVEHVEQMHRDANVGFSAEYKLIKDNSPAYPTLSADLQVNKPKNRYKNILPWDRTRVELLATDDEEGSDYINANYLPGWKHQREFIAAQGPLPGTIDDFWRMIWENRVSVVVMLTQCVEKGRTKCEQYWPKEGAQEIYGDLVVHLRSESVLPDYNIRVIDVTSGTESRMIKHFHFMQWPDFGCPERTSMLLSFVSSVRAHMPHSDCGPMVVHCSAGVGRTGTFIALDQLLQQIHGQTSEVDIFGLVMNMRDHRPMMVQTENQYIYIHDCLADAVTKDRESDDDDQSGDEEEEHIYANC